MLEDSKYRNISMRLLRAVDQGSYHNTDNVACSAALSYSEGVSRDLGSSEAGGFRVNDQGARQINSTEWSRHNDCRAGDVPRRWAREEKPNEMGQSI